eukprot:CAMPEP_0115107506 /NCGR_PEP_ID=MMETSP0227-20121206/37360_1 /TAXON_ID=89957 /ORGANISM="Polarella glacialis, Strain CCMP 1383" /LENGTH=740 /DNA_ID=CAMNT_0002505445 /DNA_START=120 /DNA_END=2342 /DNA_ORIENTATION=+
MIPLSALGRPPGSAPASGAGGAAAPVGSSGGMIPLGALGGGAAPASAGAPVMTPPAMAPPSDAPPAMAPPAMPPPVSETSPVLPQLQGGAAPIAFKPGDDNDTTLAEVGKTAKEHLDPLMPIAIPNEGEDSRPVPKQVQCLENGTDLFKMFEVDMSRFDPKAVRKGYHKMAALVHPEKLGREPSEADKARFTKLKQAYTVIMDEQLRAVYRQHCFGIAGSGGCPPQGHEAGLAKSLELGRELRKMGEDRAIVLHKAAETGWSDVQKDQDGRKMRGDGRKQAHQFSLFADVSSEEDDAELEKERRGLTSDQILDRSPKYADVFLEKVKPLLCDPKVSNAAAGGAFTMREDPKLLELLQESSKSVQRHLRRTRNSVKQMNWAMTSLLQHKDSPWRGLEVKGSLVESGCVKLLEIIRSGIAFGKFTEVHEEDFAKLIDNLHRLYMDIFERRGQELLKAAIKVELQVIYLLPESGGRLPDDSRVLLQDLASRADLNGKAGKITAWDYSLQRYTVDLEKVDKNKKDTDAPANPDMFGLEDVEDEEEDNGGGDQQLELAIPKKLMVLPKNVLVDLEPPKQILARLVKDWNAWRKRPRSVSASQDADAVAAALGPPLESMANFLQEAAQAVSTGSATGRDGAELIADECRQALSGARQLASKLLGEEPEEPPKPPPLQEPAPALVPYRGSDDAVSKALKEAAEVAQMAMEIGKGKDKKKKRSKSRKRRKKRSSSSSSSSDKKKQKKK